MSEAFTIRQGAPGIIQIDGLDGRSLLTIHPDGTVEGVIEDAGEAARRFVESLRLNLATVQAVSLPDRTDLREVLATVLSRVAFSGSGEEIGTEQFAVLVNDAIDAILPVLAALSTQPEGTDPIPRYAQLDIWMALKGSTSSNDYEPFREEHGFAETWAELCAEIRALSTQPASGEVEVTDEQVAAAAKAYWLAPGRATAAEAMRAALEAARGVQS